MNVKPFLQRRRSESLPKRFRSNFELHFCSLPASLSAHRHPAAYFMKLTRQLLSVGLALLFSAAIASAVPGRAEVKKVFGTATVTKATGGTASVTVGMVLGAGDTVATDKASCVHLWLGANGEALQVAPDTTLKLETLEITNVKENTVNTSLSLAKGAVTGTLVKKLSAASKFEIKTASGVAGIRGTVYGFKSDGTLVVLHGAVTFNYIANGQAKSVRVEPGQQFKPGDAAPTPANFMNPAVSSAFAEVLNSSGVAFDPAQGDAGILRNLSTLLDISARDLIQALVASGVADLSNVVENPLSVSVNQ